MRWRAHGEASPPSVPVARRCNGAVEVDWHRVTGGGARSSIVLGLGKHLRHVRENRGESVESTLNSKSNVTVIRARARKLEMLPRTTIFLQTFELRTTWFY